MLTDEQKKYATRAFVSLDGLRTGSIPNTKATISDAVRLSGLNPTEVEIDQLMKAAATDFADKLSKDEFMTLLARMHWKPLDEVKDTLMEDFGLFVKQRSVIKEDELMYVLSREGRERVATDEAKQIVNKFEKDQEGYINIEKLIDKLLAIVPP